MSAQNVLFGFETTSQIGEMEMLTLLLALLGVALLIKGGDMLVGGASSLASKAGISKLIIGLTVVALGTSAPEIAVTALSSATHRPDLAVGNVIGSNIANLLLVLGLAGVLTPLLVQRELLKVHLPFMIGGATLLVLLGLDGNLSVLDGFLLLVGLFLYIGVILSQNKRKDDTSDHRQEHDGSPLWRSVVTLVIGLCALLLGSYWVVEGASSLARALGVSELMIGITIVAVGTSLPEVTTMLVAIKRGDKDVGIGAIVGSNVINTLCVMGVGALSAGSAGLFLSQQVLRVELPVMLAISILVLPLALTHSLLSRREAALLLSGFGAYTLYQVLLNSGSTIVPGFVAIWFMLTALLLLFFGIAGVWLIRERQLRT